MWPLDRLDRLERLGRLGHRGRRGRMETKKVRKVKSVKKVKSFKKVKKVVRFTVSGGRRSNLIRMLEVLELLVDGFRGCDVSLHQKAQQTVYGLLSCTSLCIVKKV